MTSTGSKWLSRRVEASQFTPPTSCMILFWIISLLQVQTWTACLAFGKDFAAFLQICTSHVGRVVVAANESLGLHFSETYIQ